MTDGEVAPAQLSGLVKPAPPPPATPPAPGALRTVASSLASGGGGRTVSACECECVSAIMGRRVNPLRSAAGLICHLQKRNKEGCLVRLSLMGKLYPLSVTRALSLLLPRKDLDPWIFCHGAM